MDENKQTKKPHTHRSGLQDLVHPKQHQDHQASQEDVHEHPTEKQTVFKSLQQESIWAHPCIENSAGGSAFMSLLVSSWDGETSTAQRLHPRLSRCTITVNVRRSIRTTDLMQSACNDLG